MLLAIDGTGPEIFYSNQNDDVKYGFDNHNSHVARMHNESSEQNKVYFRGPTTVGGDLIRIVDGAMEWLTTKNKAFPKDNKLYLVGHSRGGLGVLEVARRLKLMSDQKLAVDQFIAKSHNNLYTAKKASIVGTPLDLPDVTNFQVIWVALFDCVDRDPFLDAGAVPANVKYCFHALRNPGVGSRGQFGNDATYAADATKTTLRKKYFWGTHAAIGGTPWTGDHPQQFMGNRFMTTDDKSWLDKADPFQYLSKPTITEVEDIAASFAVWRWMADNVSAVAQLERLKGQPMGDPSRNWA